MRPPKLQQSALRSPLNRILGTEANVRVLRALSRDPQPVTRTELARRAGLETKGAHRAANRLLEEGILRTVGAGTRQHVQVDERHPLASAVMSLFEAETARLDRLLVALRDAAGATTRLDAAWIEGGFVKGTDAPGEPLVVGVLARGDALPDVLDSLRAALGGVEVREEVTVELAGATRADLAVADAAEQERLRDAMPVFGPPPAVFIPEVKETRAARNRVVHGDRDEEQLALARAIAHRLERDPALIDVAAKRVAARLPKASPRERRELEEWKTILTTMSAGRLRRFLTDRGERATRLRQTMPFADLLTPAERKRAVSTPSIAASQDSVTARPRSVTE